ncbi:MAG: VWA domain-containing protein [Deltaproteobacteria bacterium]|nr:VWA domain-containing protein [Deltaproteobacteria bacterium]
MTRFLLAGIVIVAMSGAAYAANPDCEAPNMLILQDKSGSMADPVSGWAGDSKFEIARNAVQSILNTYGAQMRFGLAMFPWTGGCSVGSVRVPPGDNTSSQIMSVFNSGQAQANGSTPMADSLNLLSGESSIHDPNRRNFVLFITDGMDTCANDPNNEPVQAVSNLVSSGVQGVFVVGFGGGVDAGVLSNMAQTGGFPRAGNPSYYQADSAADLSNALNAIIDIVTQEICDGKDNDCDGDIDEGIAPQACSGLCGATGNKQCKNGAWTSCMDGQGKPIPGAGDEGKPCDTGKEGICKDGLWKCDAQKKLLCVQQKQPGTEVCNGLDDDCDGDVDEDDNGDTLVQPCVTTCGGGDMLCVNGKFDETTCDGPLPGNACGGCGLTPREECNGQDDDCDGTVDDNAVCEEEGQICISGRCIGRCVANECPYGKTCKTVQGQMMCVDDTDLACIDKTCGEGTVCQEGSCVPIPCTEGATKCQGGVRQRCESGAWKADPCLQGWECANSVCVEISCYTEGCPDGFICTAGACNDPDPCAGKSCGTDEFCRDGTCVKACAYVDCPSDTTCRDGTCFSDPCAGMTCPDGFKCSQGKCTEDPCYWVGCGIGRACVAGKCEDDPCRAIRCPGNSVCWNSQCVKPGDVPEVHYPDGGTIKKDGGGGEDDTGGVATRDVGGGVGGGDDQEHADGGGPGGGGGLTGEDNTADLGCACASVGTGGTGPAAALLVFVLGLVALVVLRRR